ncbi:MAG: hypothetical protein CSA44_01345 [Gammaproteobacteria bacterium]|nr:MAG: hypothetical protein CSA44_01345 [Gammaproteobacteria bacterium]
MNKIIAMQARMRCYQQIRQFFATRAVAEVETPILSPYGSTDVHIDSFLSKHLAQPRYLHTSPEFAMKRLLAEGFGDCFQLAKVFRNEPHSSRHRAEFTLLEWYRIGFSMDDLITEVAALVKTLCPDWHNLDIEKFTYAEVFGALGIHPHADSLPTLKQKTVALSGYDPHLADNRDEWLDFLLVTQIERHLGQNKLTFLTHYPASQAALAKKMTDNEGHQVAERFELYFQGIELANGFHELTRAAEQQQRFEDDNTTRQQLGKPVVPIDKDFIAALNKGLPECSGVALGIDRLLMLALKQNDIAAIMPFE